MGFIYIIYIFLQTDFLKILLIFIFIISQKQYTYIHDICILNIKLTDLKQMQRSSLYIIRSIYFCTVKWLFDYLH